MKTLILFGTRHYDEEQMPGQIRDVLKTIIDNYAPPVVLEEWEDSRGRSGAAAVCEERGLTWKSIGTPKTEEFKTYDYTKALDFPQSTDIPRYGPILAQERREAAMCRNITAALSAIDKAVVVIGLAHLHSMVAKLSGDFDVEGFAYRWEPF